MPGGRMVKSPLFSSSRLPPSLRQSEWHTDSSQDIPFHKIFQFRSHTWDRDTPRLSYSAAGPHLTYLLTYLLIYLLSRNQVNLSFH